MTTEEFQYIIDWGKQLYNILDEKEDTHFVICPCSIGDTINILAFLNEYKKINSIKKLVVVVKSGHEELVNLFPDVISMALSNEQMYSVG